MPTALFEACDASLAVSPDECPHPVVSALASASLDHALPEFDGHSHVFFQVTNSFTEIRTLVKVKHIVTSRTCVNVSICAVVCVDLSKSNVLLFNDQDSHRTLDLRGLMKDMGAAVAYWWGEAVRRPTAKPRGLVTSISRVGDSYELPADVGGNSSSSALVVPSVQICAQGDRDVGAEQVALQHLRRVKAFDSMHGEQGCGPVPFQSLDGVHVSTVEHLALRSWRRLTCSVSCKSR